MAHEVFQLDNDERWQARLEEARARREIALAEKAAGKPQKKRLKPWEIEGAQSTKAIEPIIQERGEDERLDFADRLEAIRAVAETPKDEAADRPCENSSAKAATPFIVRISDPELDGDEPAVTPERPPVDADNPSDQDDFAASLAPLPLPKEVRREISVVRPDAPDVEDIAARCAATLEQGVAQEPLILELPEPAVVAPAVERRRRPGILLAAVSAFALLPFATQTLPPSVGPIVQPAPDFVFQHALGVTWSLQEVPSATQSGEWVPRQAVAPVGPVASLDLAPVTYAAGFGSLDQPLSEISAGSVAWTPVPPVALGQGTKLFEPSLFEPSLTNSINPGFTNEPAEPAQPVSVSSETVQRGVPELGNAPAKPRPPAIESAQPDSVPDEASMTPPKDPTQLSSLKVTILSPTTADKTVASEIAQDLPRRGHEVVRVQEVGYSIKSRNLRYFYEKDRQEAALVAKAYDAELRDFTWYRPKPTEGTTELWLTGSGESPNPVRQARPARQASSALEPPAPQRVVTVPAVEPEKPKRSLLGRLFLSHKAQGGRVNTSDGDRSVRSVDLTDSSSPTGSGDTGRSDSDDTRTDDRGSDDRRSDDTGGSGTGDTGGTGTGDTGGDTGGSIGSDPGDSGGSISRGPSDRAGDHPSDRSRSGGGGRLK